LPEPMPPVRPMRSTARTLLPGVATQVTDDRE
jgi:hypothetical protein